MPRTLLTTALLLSLAAAARADRTTLNFDADWRFFKGTPPAPAPAQPLNANYAPIDPASFAFKDDTWRTLDLPHDWAIEGPFAQDNPTGAAGAFAPSGIAWYRKTFTPPPDAKGKKIFLEFDGIMANSETYLNKSLLGSRPNGYVPIRYDLTDTLNYTGPNLLAVRTDTSRQPAARWYTGAGINRHVRLVIQDPLHIEPMATVITTETQSSPQHNTFVTLRYSLKNESATPAICKLSAELLNPEGKDVRTDIPGPFGSDGMAIGQSSQDVQIPAHAQVTFTTKLRIPVAHLWSLDAPVLYHAKISLASADKTLDSESLPFGIRTAEFRPDTGFYLNGQNLKLKGVCLHSDLGPLGTAAPESAWESRLAALKSYGTNAIRTAHNPMPPEFYDACDKLGLLVMDELFDTWTVGKMPADYHLYFNDWWQRDLDAIIQRDRNHPSIILWSVGNEIWDILPQNPDPAADQFTGPMHSIDLAKNILTQLKDRTHQLDPTRPVTVAEMRPNVAGAYTNGFADMMDVVGQNYRDNELIAAHTQNPARKIIGTESYKTREAWIAMRDNPAYSGQFLWAGVDYLGETGGWPNLISPSGFLDTTNAPKGEALERQAWWGAGGASDKPILHLARILSIPTRVGSPNINMGFPNWTPINTAPHEETVAAYSNADSVELFLNDKSLGSKPKDAGDKPRTWQVPFAAGTLKAVAKNKATGDILAVTDELKTASAPAKILLTPERTTLPNDFDDVVYIRATLADSANTPNPNAANKITFTLTGPGKIVALDNGDITSHEPFQGTNQRSAFQGTCIAILRATDNSGEITLTATTDSLPPATIKLQAAPPTR